MPRGGGRGGRGGGRPARSGTARIAGIDIQVDEGLLEDSIAANKPAELFPKRELKLFKPLSKSEAAQVSAYRSLRDRIRDGPLYTVLGQNVRVRKETAFGSTAVICADPFENGVETYSVRYAAKKRRLPGLAEGSYALKFFPRELWEVLDPEYAPSLISSTTSFMRHGSAKQKAGPPESNSKKKRKSKLDAVIDADAQERAVDAEADDSEGEESDAGEEGHKSDQDNEFEEDEDDMVGDYNAEQYFDDGGDDAGDDYDAGGDAGGDDGMY